MAGWGKLVAGALLGVAGTVYATNEDVRKRLPKAAQDLPESVRRRFDRAVSAAREGASRRRAEILRDLEEHSHHEGPNVEEGPRPEEPPRGAAYRAGDTDKLDEFFAGGKDDTRPISRVEKD